MDNDQPIRPFFRHDVSVRKIALRGLLGSESGIEILRAAMSDEWVHQQSEYDIDVDGMLDELNEKIESEDRKARRRWSLLRWGIELAAAAAVAAAIVTVWEYRVAPVDTAGAYAELVAPENAKVQFSLPDGTKGWLNSGAKLKYPLSFISGREVELMGEGFFEVTKTRDLKPFTVLANGAKVVVWGTKFDVTADPEGRGTEVVLAEGKVEFRYPSATKDRAVMLSPGERIVYDRNNGRHTLGLTNPADYTQWIEDRMTVCDESVSRFAVRLAHRFNIEVSAGDERLANVYFRAIFEDESPEEIMRLLSMIVPIDYTMTDRALQSDGMFSRKKIDITYSTKRIRQQNGVYEQS